MDELRGWIGAVFALIGFVIAVILTLCAVALVIGLWPLALLIAAGAFYAFAKWAAGVRD